MLLPEPNRRRRPPRKHERLPSRERLGLVAEVLRLRDAERYTFREIAAKLGRPEGTVAAVYRRAQPGHVRLPEWSVVRAVREAWALGRYRGDERAARARLAADFSLSAAVVDRILDSRRSRREGDR